MNIASKTLLCQLVTALAATGIQYAAQIYFIRSEDSKQEDGCVKFTIYQLLTIFCIFIGIEHLNNILSRRNLPMSTKVPNSHDKCTNTVMKAFGIPDESSSFEGSFDSEVKDDDNDEPNIPLMSNSADEASGLLEPVVPRPRDSVLNFESPLSNKIKVALYERLHV